MELQQSKGQIKDETEWSTIYIKSSNIDLEGVEVGDTMSPVITTLCLDWDISLHIMRCYVAN